MHVATKAGRHLAWVRSGLPVSDEELMMLIAADDVHAFALFHDRYSTAAFSLATRILNDHGLAADATQEAFVQLWRQRTGYRPARGAGRTWLLGIVRNRAIDSLRRERTRRMHPSGDQHLMSQIAVDCTEDQAIAHVSALDEQPLVSDLLNKLPADQRRVVELAYYGGLTHVDIAERLGLPLGTIKGRMRLALGKMRNATSDVDAVPERVPV